MRLRTIKPAEFDQYIALSSLAFGVPKDGEQRLLKDYLLPEQILVLELGGKIVSQLLMHKLGVWINRTPIPLGGIAGTVTDPEHRNNGYATRLLQYALAYMRETATCNISALYPATYALYRRNGWVMGDSGRTYTANPSAYHPSNPSTLRNVEHRMTRLDDMRLLQSMRRRYAASRQGYIDRDVLGWHARALGKIYSNSADRWLALHIAPGGREDAYLLYGFSKPRHMEVYEIVYESPTALDALLLFLAKHDTQELISVTLDPTNPLLNRVVNPAAFTIQRHLAHLAMFRIVDVPRALCEYPRLNNEAVGRFTLQIVDQTAPWNTGCWSIQMEKGTASCSRLQDGALADATLDIATLAQLYVGYQSVPKAAREGLIRIHRPSVLSEIACLFESHTRPFSGDRF